MFSHLSQQGPNENTLHSAQDNNNKLRNQVLFDFKKEKKGVCILYQYLITSQNVVIHLPDKLCPGFEMASCFLHVKQSTNKELTI